MARVARVARVAGVARVATLAEFHNFRTRVAFLNFQKGRRHAVCAVLPLSGCAVTDPVPTCCPNLLCLNPACPARRCSLYAYAAATRCSALLLACGL